MQDGKEKAPDGNPGPEGCWTVTSRRIRHPSTAHKQPFTAQLKDLNVKKCFESLVKWGCEPGLLEELLCFIEKARGVNTWQKLIGCGGREIPTVRRRIWWCANDLERIGDSLYGKACLSFLLTCEPEDALLWPRIPSLLREFVRNFDLDFGRKQMRLRPRDNLFLNWAIAHLVRYTLHATHKPHDPEVAALIAAFGSRPNFTADVLKDWRKRHAEQLAEQNLSIADFLIPPKTIPAKR
jgi:hypothetical protein